MQSLEFLADHVSAEMGREVVEETLYIQNNSNPNDEVKQSGEGKVDSISSAARTRTVSLSQTAIQKK